MPRHTNPHTNFASKSAPVSRSLSFSIQSANGKQRAAAAVFPVSIDAHSSERLSVCVCVAFKQRRRKEGRKDGRTDTKRNADKLTTATAANDARAGAGEVAATMEKDKMDRRPLAPRFKTCTRRRTSMASKLHKSGALACVGLLFLLSSAFIQTAAGAFLRLGGFIRIIVLYCMGAKCFCVCLMMSIICISSGCVSREDWLQLRVGQVRV